MSDTLRDAALDYHRTPTPGKISVNPTKAMATQRDLALAYSPGVAEIALLAAAEVRRFGVLPRVALLSHSNFGASDAPSALKMRAAVAIAKALDPSLPIAGEMRGDAALSCAVMEREVPDAPLGGEANVLVMPNVDAANIAYNLLRIAAGNGITVGGILLGAAKPVHILAPSATVRRIVNMTALAVVDNDQQRADALAREST